jgi:hypothetical protein
MRGHVAKMMHDSSHMREMFGNIPPEQIILSWLNTENNLINHLSAWEGNYKKDIEFRKSGIFDNNTITL